ncbi:hypothetical protein MNBD_GAMMA19-589, partial [hydrothermal vent metagenome]
MGIYTPCEEFDETQLVEALAV